MKKNFAIITLVFLVIVVVTGIWMYQMFFGPAVEERVTVLLRADESYEEMTKKVKSSLEYHLSFDIYAKRINLDRGIEPGKYTFDKGMSVVQVARILKFGSDNSVLLTINNARTPEILAGKISRQIYADSLSLVNAMRNSELIKELGFESAEAMFSIFIPNTYEVYDDISPEALVRRLKRESDNYWSLEHRQTQLARVGLTPYEVMVLASIVHEETNAVEEMPRIAGVYVNRLRMGMPLQADPTLKYAAGDFTLKRVLDKHKEIESPYNTYKHLGLPPTPISMPDMAAIESVLCYEEHKYIYFCARPEMDGRHNFATTLAEHNRNAAAYHKALNDRKIR